jgi:hypothetical protein
MWGGLLDQAIVGQKTNNVAQPEATQPKIGGQIPFLPEKLLEAPLRDATDRGQFRLVIGGPPGAAFPVPDEFQFPKHTTPQLINRAL